RWLATSQLQRNGHHDNVQRRSEESPSSPAARSWRNRLHSWGSSSHLGTSRDKQTAAQMPPPAKADLLKPQGFIGCQPFDQERVTYNAHLFNSQKPADRHALAVASNAIREAQTAANAEFV